MEETPLIAGRFRLGDRIGRGGMGEVFLGIDCETGDRVAIKRLMPGLVEGQRAMLERFDREGETCRRLNHPNIVKLLATASAADEHYLVLEYVEGGSLADVLKAKGRLPVEDAIAIALELADALARAHHLNVIHRDIKPANVLLAADGTPRLSDFGVAHVEGSNLTDTGAVVGSCGYISPEALQGSPSSVLGDVWSFGAMLYEMLAGRRPFASERPAAEVLAILKDRPPELDSLRPELPVALVDLVNRMLEKEPAQRIQSMRWVAAELESLRMKMDSLPEQVTFTSANRSVLERVESGALPLQPTPFVGRERERLEISALIDDENTRLLTLLGPGGMGKTRLALEVARDKQAAFPGGIGFAPLPPEGRNGALISSIAQAIGCSLSGPEDATAQVVSFLRKKAMLLLLDGLEQHLDEAGCLGEILQEAAHVKILATSRERLRLRAERVFVCEGLAVSNDPEEALGSGAVRLFIDSARRVRPAFEITGADLAPVVEVCRWLEGMPLAIELAASWMEMLSPSEVLSELRHGSELLESDIQDVPEKHRSLRAVFESSWGKLNADEKRALAGMSLFRGGFSRDAAVEVCGASLRTLAGLANKSLLKRNAKGRYEQHEWLRQQAVRKLEQFPEAAPMRDRHAAFYAALAGQRARRLKGPEQETALRELDEEHENLRTAWDWAVRAGSDECRTQLLDGLYDLLEMKGRFVEGESFLSGSLATLDAGQQTLRATLLARRGRCALKVGRYMDARKDLEQALPTLRETGPRGEIAFCLTSLADALNLLGDFETSTRLARESLQICNEVGDRWGVESALNNLGVASYHENDYEEAGRLYRESLAIAREIGDGWGATFALNNLGVLAHELNRYDEAKSLYAQSAGLCEEIGDRHGVAAARINLARAHYELGELESAADEAEKGLEMARELGDDWSVAAALVNLGEVQRVTGERVRARESFEEARRRADEIQATALVLEALLGLGQLEVAAGDVAKGRSLLRHVEHHPRTEAESRKRARALLDGMEAVGEADGGRKMAKVLRCKHIGPDSTCSYEARGQTTEEILQQVAEHAGTVHKISEVTTELVKKAQDNIRDE